MKLLKALLVSTLAFTMVACSTTETKKEEPIKAIVPMGATSLSLLGLYEDKNVTIDTVDGSDTLSAEFNKKDGYDIIIAPINLGSKLISTGKSEYVLDSVVTWGNLYVIGTDESALTTEGVFAAFGEAAVPQKVLMNSLDLTTITPSITYFNSVNDVQAQLLSGKANVGLLAEPAATATIAKAKEKGMELKVLKDLQKEYKAKNNTTKEGYPQAALFVKKGSEEKVATYLETAKKFANETAIGDDTSVTKAVEKATVEKLGVPSAQIAQKTWARQNIKFVKANTVKEDITAFLAQFKITLDDAYYGE
ncbi:hypothetical protein ACWG0P_10305 [Amedibacillus sp. YH-ame6]